MSIIINVGSYPTTKRCNKPAEITNNNCEIEKDNNESVNNYSEKSVINLPKNLKANSNDLNKINVAKGASPCQNVQNNPLPESMIYLNDVHNIDNSNDNYEINEENNLNGENLIGGEGLKKFNTPKKGDIQSGKNLDLENYIEGKNHFQNSDDDSSEVVYINQTFISTVTNNYNSKVKNYNYNREADFLSNSIANTLDKKQTLQTLTFTEKFLCDEINKAEAEKFIHNME